MLVLLSGSVVWCGVVCVWEQAVCGGGGGALSLSVVSLSPHTALCAEFIMHGCVELMGAFIIILG